MLIIAMAAVTVCVQAASAQEQDANAAYKPKRGDCRVAPVSDETLAEIQEQTLILAATPHPLLEIEDVEDPLDATSLYIDDLPVGTPADAATVAAITALEREFAACYNAGELRRAAALLLGEAQVVFVGYAGSPAYGNRIATPEPFPREQRIESVIVRDVRFLDDGRVGALVDWGDEVNFEIYEQVEGRWLIAHEISLIGVID